MTSDSRAIVDGMLAQYEDVWGVLDQLFGSFGPDDWSREHGPDWTMADPPYHMSYFDRELVAIPIERGRDVSESDQRVWRNINELNAWNEDMFARRPNGQTTQQNLDDMNASRDQLRSIMQGMTDADLDNPIFTPLVGCGWITTGMILGGCIADTWNHSMELRMRLERNEPIAGPICTHTALGVYSSLSLIMFDPEAAAGKDLVTVMEFTGDGGGAWTVNVANGMPSVTEGASGNPDIVMTQSPDTFMQIFLGMTDPMSAMQSGNIQVQGMENMMTYGSMFPPLDPAREIPTMDGAPPLG
jgi:putative sterol carrier protein